MVPRLSVAQLATLWGCSRQHVYNLLDAGKLNCIRIGDLIRFRREDIEEYERTCQPAQPTPLPSVAPATTSRGGKAADRNGYRAALLLRAKRRFLAEFLAGLNATPIPTTPTIGKVLDGYLAARTSAHSPETLRYSCINLKRHLGDLPVERLGLIEQTAYMTARRKEGAQGASAKYRTSVRPLADGTLIRELGTLRTALRWAVSEKWFRDAPIIKLPTTPPPRHRWLTRDEARRLIAAIVSLHSKTFMGLALFTGARSGAILQLPWANVDFVAGTVYLGKSRGNKKRATVPMTDELRVILETAQEAATCPWVIEYKGKPIKSNKTGFMAAAKRAGIQGVSPHTVRHTAASWMVQAGVSYQDAGHWLGMSPEMVRVTYGHHHPDYLRNVAAALTLA